VNRLACRVMVAVAGMAVLGMTATLAGAQTHPATYTLNDVMQAPFASDWTESSTDCRSAVSRACEMGSYMPTCEYQSR
jgi:hypothetical protein